MWWWCLVCERSLALAYRVRACGASSPQLIGGLRRRLAWLATRLVYEKEIHGKHRQKVSEPLQMNYEGIIRDKIINRFHSHNWNRILAAHGPGRTRLHVVCFG